MGDSSIKMQGFDNSSYWKPYENLPGNGFEEWLGLVMRRPTRIIHLKTTLIPYGELVYEMRLDDSGYLPLLVKDKEYPILIVDYATSSIAKIFSRHINLETATVMALPRFQSRDYEKNLKLMEGKVLDLEARIREAKGIN